MKSRLARMMYVARERRSLMREDEEAEIKRDIEGHGKETSVRECKKLCEKKKDIERKKRQETRSRGSERCRKRACVVRMRVWPIQMSDRI